jgi:prevent-host-death family protein
MAETVGGRQARARLAELMARAERGGTVVITRSDREVALLGPPAQREQRRPGRMKGRMWAAPDWDETPPEMIDALEGKGETSRCLDRKVKGSDPFLPSRCGVDPLSETGNG